MKINYVFMKSNLGYTSNKDQLPLITGFVHIEDEYGGELYYEVTFENGEKDYVSLNDINNHHFRFVVQ